MSYASLLRNIPEILSQPTGIAAIASLGIHGAIALIVPLMPVDSSKPKATDSSKTVGLLELSQADQSRLPQTPLDSPQVALQQQLPAPNFGGQTTIFPPSPASVSNQMGMPVIPSSTANFRTSSSPRRQSSWSLGNTNNRFDTSSFNIGSKYSSASRFNEKNVRIVGESLPVNRLPQVQADNSRPRDIGSDLADIAPTTAARENTTQQTMPNGDGAAKVTQNGPLGSPMAAIPQSNVGPDGQSVQPSSLNKAPELPGFNKPESSSKVTDGAIAQGNLEGFDNLRKAVLEEYPNSKQQPVIRDTISTDKPGLEGTVLGRLVLHPDGKVLDIKFQDKSVNPELESKAREYFNAKRPKADQRISSYPFNLRFQNNSSQTNAVTSELKPTPSTTIKPAAPSANNQPVPTPSTMIKPASAPSANNQPVPTPSTMIKPASAPSANNQPVPTPSTTIKPASAPSANNNQPVPTPEANKIQPASSAELARLKLTRQLRQLKQEQQNNSNQK
ncbi:hypothetical protein Cylst_2934 [Cylindrospermum stagnale PCC 7417]|uniref:Gram-negative bacterial tonB protein n=1 Tax=Cylindrospermum stagnale PCC 7417 TaxID=56107 RepID=K9WZ90_9NOST|nr:hypothetical protein [Cylindrospermum stagnale]AFZ25106.1 hypothetical protein Cylst_2934 [Cylindrospermum stagnale PCC 7417]